MVDPSYNHVHIEEFAVVDCTVVGCTGGPFELRCMKVDSCFVENLDVENLHCMKVDSCFVLVHNMVEEELLMLYPAYLWQ